MKVVIAPDKFAGTMTASQAAAAIARGWARVRPDDDLVAVPMADGGEGLFDVVSAVVPADVRRVTVTGPLGEQVDARWLLLEDGRAVVEAAEAIGLRLVPAADRNPLRATSQGLGELIAAVRQAGCREIVVGLGGSATVDGGAGMAVSVGALLEDRAGRPLRPTPVSLGEISRIRMPPQRFPPIVAAVDVDNPLLGAHGAARTFGAQKGARPDDIDTLESALRRFADVVERDLRGGPWRDHPGAGAAGGLGFALLAFTGARVAAGAAVVGDLVGLRDAMATADVVVTGEGSLDVQTLRGKAPDHVRRLAREVGVPVAAVAGRVSAEAAGWFDATAELGDGGLAHPVALAEERSGDLAARLSQWAKGG